MRALAIALMSIAVAAIASAQTISDEAVRAAIAAGQMKRFKHLVSECYADAGMGASLGAAMVGGVQPIGGFKVVVAAAEGRIAWMAAEGKRLYKPVNFENVPETVRSSSTLFVTVIPEKPDRTNNGVIHVPAKIESVVLKSKINPSAFAQPSTFESNPVEFPSPSGGKFAANSAVATFDKRAVLEFPKGDFDVVVVTDAGERRCKVGAGDRAKLLK